MNSQVAYSVDLSDGRYDRLSTAELDDWLERLADVPDIRMAKVTRIRRAIRTNSYDENRRIDRILPGLAEEVNVLASIDGRLDEPPVDLEISCGDACGLRPVR